MRRVGQLHAITDETLQSASLTALAWLLREPQAAAVDYFDRLFRSGWRPRVPAGEHQSIAVANLVPQQITAVYGHILPLIFINPDDWEKMAQGDVLSIPDVRNAIRKGNRVKAINLTQNGTYETEHPMTPRQVEMVLAGSLINLVRQKRA